MADTVTTTKTLAIGFEYVDSETAKTKTAYLKIPNFKTSLTETQIKNAAQNLISGENPILKDPQDKNFDTATAIATAYTETVETTELDLE